MSELIRIGLLYLTISCLVAAPAAADVFTVNVRSDDPEVNPGDGVCDTGSMVSGEAACSLRAAIQEASALDGADIIEFSVLVATPYDIPVDSSLTITGSYPLIIDGTTESGYSGTPVIEVNGTTAGTNADGFVIKADGVVIQGLAIINFDGDGIQINSDQNVIGESYIGVAADGSAAGNHGQGIDVDGTGNTIGDDGTYGTGGNVISANTFNGITVSSDNNTIQANYIGTDPSGTVAMANGLHGVSLLNASSNTIGGTDASARNVISGNDDHGILIDGTTSASSNIIQGNYIGLDVSGTAALGNDGSGIRIAFGASNNTVGGTDADARNVLSGNGAHGILIESSGTTDNVVQGNYIGTNAAGDAAVGNGSNFGQYDGAIHIQNGASDNLIGGTTTAARNVIAGNDGNGSDSGNGITLAGSGTTGNIVIGNYIGINASGNAALANYGNGVQVLSSASNNRIGVDSGNNVIGNVIGGNRLTGVKLGGGASSNLVKGNYIGVAADGSTPIGNGAEGVQIRYAAGSNNIIGHDPGDDLSSSTPEGNVIAHNGGTGVLLAEENSTASGNSVRGNQIFANSGLGIDLSNDNSAADGQTANDAGDGDDGINNLQNFPEIVEAEYNEHADQVSVTYRVTSDPNASGTGASVYPLTIDFYKADADEEEGAVYLGSTTYTASAYDSGPETWVGFTPAAPVTRSDKIIATATDADGNTSEFSAQSQSLPVELTALKAAVDGEAVQLTWRTVSETDNAGFAVQRKVEGAVSFEEIGFVEGYGTTSEAQAYRFEDANLPYAAERVTYRLEQVDTDGASEYSPEVEVALNTPETLVLHGNYPNPARSTTAIRYAVPKAMHVQLTLYDMLGRQVAVLVDRKQAAGRKEVTVDTSTLPSGLYLYRLQTGAEVETRRMTVVK